MKTIDEHIEDWRTVLKGIVAETKDLTENPDGDRCSDDLFPQMEMVLSFIGDLETIKKNLVQPENNTGSDYPPELLK